jgi:DNA-binding transcriptional MerR regulator
VVGRRYFGHQSPQKLMLIAKNMGCQLSNLIQYIEQYQNLHMDITKDIYRKAISTLSKPEDLTMEYIKLCEELQFEISNAELQSLFPITDKKMREWLNQHQQETGDKFQREFGDLLKAVEEDLNNQLTNSTMAPRVNWCDRIYQCW